MQIPAELRGALESLAIGQPQAPLARIAQALSERYRGETGSGKRLLSTDQEAAAYAMTRMPATYCAVLSALHWSLKHMEPQFSSLLDVGAGTGAVSWAAISLLPELNRIICIEREDAMRRAGQKLAQAGPELLRNAEWRSCDLAKERVSDKADIVVASYVLGEMTGESRRRVAEGLWDAAGQMLLVVGPGTPAGFAQLGEVRSLLLARGAHIAAPCPHEQRCPISEEDWCHFTCRVPRSRLHRVLKGGDAPFEDEKFCYIAFTKTSCNKAQSRVLRHPGIEPGRITLTSCTPDGIKKAAILKRDGEVFKRARKATCGDEMD